MWKILQLQKNKFEDLKSKINTYKTLTKIIDKINDINPILFEIAWYL